ncbi:MAG: hypothetical protein C0392_00600 [Syntrophus sp. (in: bacteria)]|nr:hypothetical protein [Syntrophus sp. (in: bacteria)]
MSKLRKLPTSLRVRLAKMRDIPAMKCPAVSRWLSMAGQDHANFIRENFGVLNRGAIHFIEGKQKPDDWQKYDSK